MKKKICLSVLCLVVLIGVSGCGSKEEKLLGNWASEKSNDFIPITFKENHKCSVITGTKDNECEWVMKGNKITMIITIENGEKLKKEFKYDKDIAAVTLSVSGFL